MLHQSAPATSARLNTEPGAAAASLDVVTCRQDLFVTRQRQTLDKSAAAITLLAERNPHETAPKDLEVFRQNLLALRASLVVDDQLGQRLDEDYKKQLEKIK